MNLIDVARQCGDQDLLRQLAETTLAMLMDFEVRSGPEPSGMSGVMSVRRWRDRLIKDQNP
jgi:hypothetical protein